MTSARRSPISNAKVPPYSVHAEKVVLGSMLQHSEVTGEIQKIIESGKAFFRPEYGRLFDLLLQGSHTQQSASVEATVGEKALHELLQAAAPPAMAIEQARIVAEKYRMRQLIDALSDIIHDAYHNSDEGFDTVLKRAKKRLNDLNRLNSAFPATPA